MTTSDQNQPQPPQTHGGEQGAGTAAAPAAQQPDAGGERGGRHGRRRRGPGGRPEPRQPSQPQRRPDTGLNMEELRELTELFSAHGLTDFEFENADIRIRLSRNPAPTAAAQPLVPAAGALAAMQAAGAVPAQAATPPGASQPATESAPAQAAATPEPAAEEELHVITSPIVGTFYRAASPTAEPFVKVGSQVENDSVVCIIEAMKLMNEIQAETAGTVAKIYVENGQPVEYGQPLFGVKK
jgi:acetyl-CoA carboxylase biotin carboxyl carrier protein